MNKEIEKALVKFLMNTANIEDLEKLTDWLKKKEHKQIFKSYVKTNYAMEINMNAFDSENAKKEYLHKIRRDKSVFYKHRFQKVFKYAAAIVVFVGLGYLYQQGFFTNDSEIIAPVENITLQLENGNIEIINEDGSRKIVDAQGQVVGAQNGTQLIYTSESVKKALVYNTLTVPYGKRFEVHLSDGTIVNLNAGTSLKYPVKFIKGKNRQVFLNGEAYFNVAKDVSHPFIVNANEVDIRVLGTQFNVTSYPEDEHINTVLVKGAVSIYDKATTYNAKTSTLLKPGFKAAWNKSLNDISIEAADIEMHTAWIDGKIILKHIAFKSIIKKLERHYNVIITNNNKALDDVLFTTSFDIETIEEAFQIFNAIYPIDYIIEDNKITIN